MSICAMFAVFNPILFGDLEDYYFNMCLYYICLGANIAYFNLMSGISLKRRSVPSCGPVWDVS